MLHTVSQRQTIGLLVAMVVLACSTPAVAGKPGEGRGPDRPSYQIMALDNADGAVDSSAHDISNSGLVVGQVKDPVLDSLFAACWTIDNTDGVLTSSLHLLPGGAAAHGVNDLGEIVGLGPNHVLDVARYWPSMDGPALPLPPLPGDSYSMAEEISNDGVVCGKSLGREGFGSSAVVWRVNLVDGDPVVWGPLELPMLVPASEGPDTNFGNAISDNDSNGIACIAGESGPAAVAWTVEPLADGTLALDSWQILDIYGKARGVNNDGVVCGTSFSQSEAGWEALVWGETTQILARNRYVSNAHAHDINGGGVIAGEGSYSQKSFGIPTPRAVVWTSATASIVLLDEFLPRTSPFLYLDRATAVNDAGMIVGIGSKGSPSYGAFLAIPEQPQ